MGNSMMTKDKNNLTPFATGGTEQSEVGNLGTLKSPRLRGDTLFQRGLLFFLLLFFYNLSFALPFSFTPLFLPTTVESGLETFAYYRVTNTTTQMASNSFVKFLPPYVKQGINKLNPEICGPLFNLAPGGSCILKLVVAGPVNAKDPKPQHHLFVCRQNGKTCAGPKKELNVTTTSLRSIAIVPETASIPAGTTQRFRAVGTFANGKTRPLVLVTWASSIPAFATINRLGIARGISAGTTTITATRGSISSSPATLTVKAVTLDSIAVTPIDPSIVAGTTQQFTAIGTYSNGTNSDITQSVLWTSDNTAVATINSGPVNGGLATGISSVGSPALITASLESKSDSTHLAVTPAEALLSITITPSSTEAAIGSQVQFTAIGTFLLQPPQDITNSVLWSSSNTNIATISSFVDAGIATGLEFGTTSISATSGSITSNIGTLKIVPQVFADIFAGTSNFANVCISHNSGSTWGSCFQAGSSASNVFTSLTNSANIISGGINTSSKNFWYTTDGGSSSASKTVGTSPINAMTSRSGTVYVGEIDGKVCVSADSGLTFSPCIATQASQVLSLAARSSNIAYAGLLNGNVCVTVNSGATWPVCPSPTMGAESITALAAETGFLYAGTVFGKFCISVNDGVSWQSPCISVSATPIEALTIDANGYVYAGLGSGQVCVSYDHGSSFTYCPAVPGAGTVYSLTTDFNNFIYAGTAAGTVCVSTDLGQTWPADNCSVVRTPSSAIRSLTSALAG